MIVGCRVYQRSKIPAMASQRRDGLQKEWNMANVHGLYRLEQVLPLARIDQIIDSSAGCDIMACWIVFQAITRYGSAGKMKKRLVS
jgi:hypothetical protein